MVATLMWLLGLVCLFKNEIPIDKEKSVRGIPIIILGLILIACSELYHYLMNVVGLEKIVGFIWYVAACFIVPLVYLIFIIIFCGKPIEDKE